MYRRSNGAGQRHSVKKPSKPGDAEVGFNQIIPLVNKGKESGMNKPAIRDRKLDKKGLLVTGKSGK